MRYNKSIIMSAMILSTALGLGGCIQSPPQTPPTPRLIYTCPRIVEYDTSTMQEAYREYTAALKQYPVLIGLISDYLGLRDAIRVCQDQSRKALGITDTTQTSDKKQSVFGNK